MSASTLASMFGADLTTVLDPTWLGAHLPAVILAVGLSTAIEIAMASVRRASMLLTQATDDDLGLSEAEVAELAVQAELTGSREDDDSAPAADRDDAAEPVERRCPWCTWTTSYPRRLQAVNAVKAHQRFCKRRPAVQSAAGG